MPSIFCIIPAYNEEKNIEAVLNSLKKYNFEIIVIDDGSRDETAKIVARSGVKLIQHLLNRGQGAALQTGNEYALGHGADIIVHFDADGQFTADEIQDMIEPLENNTADIVFGSRFLEKRSHIPFLKRYFLLPLAKIFNLLFFGVVLSDPQIGFRALSQRAAKSINIENDGMAHCSEIIAKAFSGKMRIKEIPVTVIYHGYGQNFSGGAKIAKDIMLNKIIR